MRILIINGANLNLLGTREPGIYGSESFDSYLPLLKAYFPHYEIDYFQSNREGELVDAIQQAAGKYDGIVLNAGGYTHTSVVIADAVAAVSVPVVEVHVSSILSREPFRHVSLLAPHCKGTVMGFGLDSYRLGICSFMV